MQRVLTTGFGTAFAAAILTAMAAMPAAAQYTEAWRASGFVMPESVAFDPGTNTLFVSNINSPDMSANGQGYVTRLGIDGAVVTEKFVEGLNAPKGIDIVDGRMFVAGIAELVEVDLAAAAITGRYPLPGAVFLNDVKVAPDGRVFVTETLRGAVYVLENGALTEFVTDPAITGANGITIEGDRLLIAPLGDISGGFANLPPQRIMAIDLATRVITPFAEGPVGVLDGIEPAGDGAFLVTDNPAGTVLRVDASGAVDEIVAPGSGAADFEFVAETGLIVVPMLNSGEVVAYGR